MLKPNSDSSPDALAPEVSAHQGVAEQPAQRSASSADASSADAAASEEDFGPLSLMMNGDAVPGFNSSSAGKSSAADHSLSTAPSEPADDASMREFYSQLVTLLTQDSAAPAKKKSRNNLLAILRRRWFPALLVSGLAFAGLFFLLRPKQSIYQASVTLLLPPRAAPGNQDPFASPEVAYDTQAELAIISEDRVVREAMSRVPPQLKLRGWGSPDVEFASVDAQSFTSPSLITISVSSLDLRASLRFSQEMVRAYVDNNRRRFQENRDDNLKITRDRMVASEKLLNNARDELRRFKERTGISDATSQSGSTSLGIDSLQNELAKVRDEIASNTENFTTDTRLDALRQQAFDARAQYETALKGFLPGSDRVRRAEAIWRQAATRAQVRSSEINASNNRRLAQLETQLASARSRAATLPTAEKTLNQLNERVQLAQTAYRVTSERFNQLKLSRDTVSQTARQLHDPSVSSSLRSQLIRAMAVSLLASLGLGVLGAWAFNRMDRTVRTIADPDALFDVPILGVMPATGGAGGIQLSGINTKKGRSALQTATIEACYLTQSHLLATAKALDTRSILFTSAVPGEGKSQCASNLATAMAYGGQTVLLIDADFLHPSQHQIFKMSMEPGYAQVLQDTATLTQAVRSTNVSNLHLLGAGKNVLANPEELIALLDGPAHQQNLKELGKYYDVILIDGPPTMSMADAQLLSNMADSIVMVTAEKTNQEEVYRARSMLRLAGGLLLGVIVNSVHLNEMSGWNLNTPAEQPLANYANSLRQRAH